MESNNQYYVDMILPGTQIDHENHIVNVRMTEDQFEEMMYCIDQVQRNRERARQSYYERKGKDTNTKKKRNVIPATQRLQEQMQQEQRQRRPEILGGGLRLVVNR